MEYRSFRDWNISAIGMGCYGLSGSYGHVDWESYQRTLQRAYELGINFFDTAQAYGEAETFLGQVIRPFRKKIYLATKVSGTEGPKAYLSEAAVQAACHASLKKLGTDYIDLYQVHFDDPHTPVEVTVAALDRLVSEGKIRHYGVCHLPVQKIREYLAFGDVFSILMELSVVARTARDTLLPLCREHNLAALAFSVTGRGGLTGRLDRQTRFGPGDIRRMDPLFQRERFESMQRVARKFAEIGKGYGASAVQVAIAWVLAQEGIVCALTGTSKVPHLEENVKASELHLKPEDLRVMEAFLEAEEAAIASCQKDAIRAILTHPLPASPEAAFNDLVYALETAVIIGWSDEKDIYPIFRELFSLKEKCNVTGSVKLVEMQTRIRELLQIDY